jgi:hypothetical protein
MCDARRLDEGAEKGVKVITKPQSEGLCWLMSGPFPALYVRWSASSKVRWRSSARMLGTLANLTVSVEISAFLERRGREWLTKIESQLYGITLAKSASFAVSVRIAAFKLS